MCRCVVDVFLIIFNHFEQTVEWIYSIRNCIYCRGLFPILRCSEYVPPPPLKWDNPARMACGRLILAKYFTCILASMLEADLLNEILFVKVCAVLHACALSISVPSHWLYWLLQTYQDPNEMCDQRIVQRTSLNIFVHTPSNSILMTMRS
jgi:hypothetical protein